MIEQATWAGRKERNPINNNNNNHTVNNRKNVHETGIVKLAWLLDFRHECNRCRPARFIYVRYDSSKKDYGEYHVLQNSDKSIVLGVMTTSKIMCFSLSYVGK